ncbi:MAG: hypothetical protein ACRCT1_03850, partial [Microcoleaceae cyanobacterium]
FLYSFLRNSSHLLNQSFLGNTRYKHNPDTRKNPHAPYQQTQSNRFLVHSKDSLFQPHPYLGKSR